MKENILHDFLIKNKKILIIFLSLSIVFSLVACTGNLKFTETENKTKQLSHLTALNILL